MESDQELIEAANKGDPKALETLYYRYRDWVYNLAWRFTGHRDLALDVLQETFAYLLRKFPGFQLTASMTTFLYPTVKHLSLALRHKSRQHRSGEETLSDLAAAAPNQESSSRAELAAVLTALPQQQQEVLLMRFVDDMKLQEIAEALRLPVSTVKSSLYRGLETLRYDPRTRNYLLE